MLAIFSTEHPGKEILVSTAIALVLFLASLAGYLPEVIFGLRVDLLLMIILSLAAMLSAWFRK